MNEIIDDLNDLAIADENERKLAQWEDTLRYVSGATYIVAIYIRTI